MLKIKFSGTLRSIAGQNEIAMELPESRRLADVLDALVKMYPGILGTSADYQWRHGSSHVIVAINGRVVDDESADVRLADGDEVSLLPPLGGGTQSVIASGAKQSLKVLWRLLRRDPSTPRHTCPGGRCQGKPSLRSGRSSQ